MFDYYFVGFVDCNKIENGGIKMNQNKVYHSIDEIERLDFRDCELISMAMTDEELRLELEALIIKANNSQNENYTDSYAGPTIAKLEGCMILEVAKEGYRYYNSKDELVSEVPDQILNTEDMVHFSEEWEGSYLSAMEPLPEKMGIGNKKFCYRLYIETVSDEDYGSASDSFRIDVAFDRAIFTWNFYQNRVQQF